MFFIRLPSKSFPKEEKPLMLTYSLSGLYSLCNSPLPINLLFNLNSEKSILLFTICLLNAEYKLIFPVNEPSIEKLAPANNGFNCDNFTF